MDVIGTIMGVLWIILGVIYHGPQKDWDCGTGIPMGHDPTAGVLMGVGLILLGLGSGRWADAAAAPFFFWVLIVFGVAFIGYNVAERLQDGPKR